MYQDSNGFWHQDYAGESVACANANAMAYQREQKQLKEIQDTLDQSNSGKVHNFTGSDIIGISSRNNYVMLTGYQWMALYEAQQRRLTLAKSILENQKFSDPDY